MQTRSAVTQSAVSRAEGGPRRGSAPGFTLAELLAVFAIAAALAAALFPVLAAARGKARQTPCASNEKQIGLAILQYAQDHDGAIVRNDNNSGPGGTDCYITFLRPYIKDERVFTCPDDPAPTPVLGGHVTSYVINNCYYNDRSIGGLFEKYPASRLAAVEDPGGTVALADGSGLGNGNPYDYQIPNIRAAHIQNDGSARPSDPPALIGGSRQGSIVGRHWRGAYCAFMDGHVQWMSMGTLAQTRTTPDPRYRSYSTYYPYFTKLAD